MMNISNRRQRQGFSNSLSKGKNRHCYLLWSLLSLVKVDVHVTRDNQCSSDCTERRQQENGPHPGAGAGAGAREGVGAGSALQWGFAPSMLRRLVNHKADEEQRGPEP